MLFRAATGCGSSACGCVVRLSCSGVTEEFDATQRALTTLYLSHGKATQTTEENGPRRRESRSSRRFRRRVHPRGICIHVADTGRSNRGCKLWAYEPWWDGCISDEFGAGH